MAEKTNIRAKYVVLLIWLLFLLLSGVYFVRVMIPNHCYYSINNPYTMDSVWNAEENTWHNDILLYTLFSKKTVYINPESWYATYVDAFAEKVVTDNTIRVFAGEEDTSQYTCINHMIAIANNTLFNQDIIDLISERAPEGAAYLYIVEDELLSSNAIEVFHDEVGNLYLRGHKNE